MTESALQLWHGVLFRQRPDFSFESISPHVQQWTGLDPCRALEVLHPADRAKIEKDHVTFRLRHAQTGVITWVEQHRCSIANGYEGIWENVTRRIHLSHQLGQSHWNGTLGAATQRLVHDFNNLLTGILSLSDAYLTRVEVENPAREGLRLLNQNARQAAEIVQHIGALFREIPGQRSYQSLREATLGAAEMLRRVLPRHSTVKVEGDRESIPVYLDAAELKQVIVSLGLTLTPPITLHPTQNGKTASLRIEGGAMDLSQASLHAQTFADWNEAEFTANEKGYWLRFPLADFSEADRDAARPRSILIVGEATEKALELADFLRRNQHSVVVGAEELLRSPDYRFDAVWVCGQTTALERLRKQFPRLKRILQFTGESDSADSLFPDADVVFPVGTSQEEILAKLTDALKP